MKIIDYDLSLDKKRVTDMAYRVCNEADFPVEYQDVYEHLFGSDGSILKLLLNEEDVISGFGVFDNYELVLDNSLKTMLYLSGMVIDPRYQRKGISRDIIKMVYTKLRTDLVSLRTQNIAMAKSLLKTFDDSRIILPDTIDDEVLVELQSIDPFKGVNEFGVIKNCYSNQLYSDIDAINSHFGVDLGSCDALGVIVEPNKVMKKSLF